MLKGFANVDTMTKKLRCSEEGVLIEKED